MKIDIRQELPAEIARVLDASTIDGAKARAWLGQDVTRSACLLNILAVLCVTPATGDPLIESVRQVFAVHVDRIGIICDGWLRLTLDRLVADVRLPFYADGGAPLGVHREILAAVPTWAGDFTAAAMHSYRGEGEPSLQIVIADSDQAHTVADIDLDLSNPLQDVVGFVRHMGELVRGKHDGPTNHLEMRDRLARGPAAPWLCYTLEDA